MEEIEMREAIEALKKAMDILHSENQALNEKVDELNRILFEDILDPVKQAVEVKKDDMAFEDFKNQYYNDDLASLANEYSTINPEQDMMRDVYEAYKPYKEEYEEADFVEASLSSIRNWIDSVKKSLGLTGDVTIEEKDGEIEVKEDGETVAEVAEPEVEPVAEEPEMSEVDEIAAFEQALEEEMKKSK